MFLARRWWWAAVAGWAMAAPGAPARAEEGGAAPAAPTAPAAPAVPSAASYWHLSLGAARGIELGRDLRKAEVRGGWEQVFHPALSAGPELALVRFTGHRQGAAVDTLGATAVYQLKWHALRWAGASLDLQFGMGGAAFARPFPPGGTRLNGASLYGVGLVVPLGARWLLLADVRGFHHSNGRGLVTTNPAFDGTSVDVGVGVRP